MRIAIVGSHATGKSTLVSEIASAWRLASVDEAYCQLLSAGHAFTDAPTVEDFEMLFDASVATFAEHCASSVVFDRSPADYLAYLAALQPGTVFADRIAATTAALQTLDLVVFIPIERPDRIADAELPRLRRRVDALLREMMIDQTWGWAIPVLEVRGTPNQRATDIARYLAASAPSSRNIDIVVQLPAERCNRQPIS